MDTQYLLMVSHPSITLSNPYDMALTEREITEYFYQLDQARYGFMEFLSKCPEPVALGYLDELVDVSKVYRSYYDNPRTGGHQMYALRSLLQSFENIMGFTKIMDLIVANYIRSIAKMKDFAKTLSPQKASQLDVEPRRAPISKEPSYEVKVSPQPAPNAKANVKGKTAIISGTQGLAEAIGCSKSMAFSIIKSKRLQEEGIQYMVGRCWKFNRTKLEEYLSANPDILSKVRCKS